MVERSLDQAALQDLASIFRYIRRDDPNAARRVRVAVSAAVAKLASTEERGRKGEEVPGTRELVFHPWPYIAVYEIIHDEVVILRIRHAPQLWP
jgi:toxin ParE1/3/4